MAIQKDFLWATVDEATVAKRYFAGNDALYNFHLPNHTNQCFRKSPECFANLPEEPFKILKLHYEEEMISCADWCGKPPRAIFCYDGKRNSEDASMNVHNKLITLVPGLNDDNVTGGLNRSSVFYCIGYNTKSRQKEERKASLCNLETTVSPPGNI